MNIDLFDYPLFVGAHADDIELFAGGTVARFSHLARLVTFSVHRGQERPSSKEEVWAAADKLGVGKDRCIIIDLAACQPYPDSFEAHRESVALLLHSRKPASVVITHQSTDTNQDHKVVHDEVKRVFKADTPIICGCFAHNDLPPANRLMFVKLSTSEAAAKVRALKEYKSQVLPHRKYFESDALVADMEYFGRLIGHPYAEAFEVIRLWV